MNEMPIMNQQNKGGNHLTLAISEQDIERVQERFNYTVACICELGLRTQDLESISLHSTQEVSEILQSIHEQAHMPILIQLKERAMKLWRFIEAHAITHQNPSLSVSDSQEFSTIMTDGLNQLATNLQQMETRSNYDPSFAIEYLKACELVSEEDVAILATYSSLATDTQIPKIDLPSWIEESMYAHLMPELEMKSKEVFESKQNELAKKKLQLLIECNVFDVNASRHD